MSSSIRHFMLQAGLMAERSIPFRRMPGGAEVYRVDPNPPPECLGPPYPDLGYATGTKDDESNVCLRPCDDDIIPITR